MGAASPHLTSHTVKSTYNILSHTYPARFTPVGAASLIAEAVGSTSDLAGTFRSLGLFVLAESAGNALLVLLVLPLLFLAVTRRNPLAFLLHAARPVVTGMASPSS